MLAQAVFARPEVFGTVVDGSNFTTGQNIDGAGSDDTLFVNCNFSLSSGSQEATVRIRGAAGITYRKCDIDGTNATSGWGVRLRNTATTDGIHFEECTIHDCDADAIIAAEGGVPYHTNLVIWRNIMFNLGLDTVGAGKHGVYIQAHGYKILENILYNIQAGNGISVRTDGEVRGNTVEMVHRPQSKAPSGIKYFSDHDAQASSTLTIAENIVDGRSIRTDGSWSAIETLQSTGVEVASILIEGNTTLNYVGDATLHIDDDAGIPTTRTGNIASQANPSCYLKDQVDSSESSALRTSMAFDVSGLTLPEDDWLVVVIQTDGNTSAEMTPPASWTAETAEHANGDSTLHILSKKMTVSEPSSYEFSWTSSVRAVGSLLQYAGDATDIVGSWNSETDTVSAASHQLSAVTPPEANCIVLYIGGAANAQGDLDWNIGEQIVNLRENSGSATAGAVLRIQQIFSPRAARTPPATVTPNAADHVCRGQLVLLP